MLSHIEIDAENLNLLNQAFQVDMYGSGLINCNSIDLVNGQVCVCCCCCWGGGAVVTSYSTDQFWPCTYSSFTVSLIKYEEQ